MDPAQNPTSTNNDNHNDNPTNDAPWYKGVDEALLTDKVKGFKDLGSFVKSYNEGQSFIGKGIPDENTPQEIKDAFYAKLGRPESADAYDWQPPEGISVEGATAENFKAFKKMCFDNGLTNKQVSAVMGGWSDFVKDIFAKQVEARQQIMNESKSALSAPNEWGDNFQNRLDAVLAKIDELGVREHLETSGVLYSTNVLKAFDSIISASNETSIKGADGKNVSPSERLEQLKANPAYFNAGHPDHAAVIAEANSIFSQMSK